MYGLSFDQVEILDKKNTRKQSNYTKPKGQNYDGFKFVKNSMGKENFTFSNVLFDNLQFEKNGFAVAKGAGKVFLFVFPEGADHTVFFKSAKKGGNKAKSTKSDFLRDVLVEAGLLETVTSVEEGKVSAQYLNLVSIENFPKTPDTCLGTYEIVKDTPKKVEEVSAETEDEDEDESNVVASFAPEADAVASDVDADDWN